jgi:hypothetical protein
MWILTQMINGTVAATDNSEFHYVLELVSCWIYACPKCTIWRTCCDLSWHYVAICSSLAKIF